MSRVFYHSSLPHVLKCTQDALGQTTSASAELWSLELTFSETICYTPKPGNSARRGRRGLIVFHCNVTLTKVQNIIYKLYLQLLLILLLFVVVVFIIIIGH